MPASRIGAAQCDSTGIQHIRRHISYNVSVYPTLLCQKVDVRKKGASAVPALDGHDSTKTQTDPATFLPNSKELPVR
jgi:hypothetical protein